MIHWSVCGADARISHFTGVVVLAPTTVICITVVVLVGACLCTNNLPWGTNLRKCLVTPTASSSVSYVRARSPIHDFGRLYAAGARVPHYIRAERPLFGRCGTSPVSSATCIRLTSFPMFSPKSIDAGCGGSRVGPHSCSTTWGTPGAYKGTWSPIHWSGCGADARVSPFTWGIPVS